jgi:Holliday junction resolvasome RuvABC endonuclease subunit
MRLLSVDPGSYATGWAIWKGERPISWGEIECPKGEAFETRLARIVREFQALGLANRIEAVAIERPFLADHRPAPELNATFRRLRQVARRQGWQWHPYHPSTIVAAVRPRQTRGWPAKDVIATGIYVLYGLKDLPQNVLDAVATGHYHLSHVVPG